MWKNSKKTKVLQFPHLTTQLPSISYTDSTAHYGYHHAAENENMQGNFSSARDLGNYQYYLRSLSHNDFIIEDLVLTCTSLKQIFGPGSCMIPTFLLDVLHLMSHPPRLVYILWYKCVALFQLFGSFCLKYAHINRVSGPCIHGIKDVLFWWSWSFNKKPSYMSSEQRLKVLALTNTLRSSAASGNLAPFQAVRVWIILLYYRYYMLTRLLPM